MQENFLFSTSKEAYEIRQQKRNDCEREKTPAVRVMEKAVLRPDESRTWRTSAFQSSTTCWLVLEELRVFLQPNV
jgi:hypothetical protein